MIECVDLSVKSSSVEFDVVYSRLFGKGKHNIYQFSDDELLTIDYLIESLNSQAFMMIRRIRIIKLDF